MVPAWGTHGEEMALVIRSMVIMVWGSRERGSTFPEGDLRPTAGTYFAWISLRAL